MKSNQYLININELPESQINHGTGNKKVFINNEDTDTALTQFSWSRFEPNESCRKHSHPTMDEYFFVYKGSGTYEIGKELFELKEGDFIRIPANIPHNLKVSDSDDFLELIYFGISTST